MTQYLEIIGALVGLVYIWLEYKASIHLWIVGVIMPAIYIFVYYDAGLYADFGISIYYLLAAAYGWAVWKAPKELPISPMPMKYIPILAFCLLTLFLGIAWVLIYYTDSNVPWIDSFPTALSIIGMWMLARKYIEQWWVWIVVDIICCGLYIYKKLPFTAGLYGLYAVIAVFGYYKWKELMKAQVK